MSYIFILLFVFFFFLMIRRPPRSTRVRSSAASDVYKRQVRAPQSDYDWLCSGGCAVEFGEHCGRAALHHFIVIKLITRLDVLMAVAHEAGTRLDSDDFAVKRVSVPFEV